MAGHFSNRHSTNIGDSDEHGFYYDTFHTLYDLKLDFINPRVYKVELQ